MLCLVKQARHTTPKPPFLVRCTQARKLAEHNIVESIMIGERALLYTMNFHVKVDIPLWTSGQFTKQLSTVGLNWGKEKETATYTEKQKNAVQLAINFANDRCDHAAPRVHMCPAECMVPAGHVSVLTLVSTGCA